MIERLFWRPLARFLTRPAVTKRLIGYAMRTPYLHLPSNEDRATWSVTGYSTHTAA